MVKLQVERRCEMENFKERLCWYGMYFLIVVAILLFATVCLIGYGLWLLFKGGQICLRKITG